MVVLYLQVMTNHRLPISIGAQFGDWTVIGEGTVKHEGRFWLCRCSCGAEKQIVGSRLSRGVSTNCGHRRWGRSAALSDAEYFWTKLAPPDDKGCRVYTGAQSEGYGIHSWQGTPKRAHRLAWELANNQTIPIDIQVCHKCDNPPCCEPSHLFLGTTQDNTQDRENKGRGPQEHRNPRAKLTADNVRDIRTRYDEGGITIQSLADEYGLSKPAMWQAIRRKNWRDVD